ncbi:hypothetical protein [Stenotrophomonas sp. Iso1]|uniref:hypothetical protein n=1 Tax=Stenotrophomonas sp. Iso1 TaxID=2977283 RepID=UPI0022B7C806|nr:hypothetical protein [Stenotrophomonas sp. Iso1]
MAEKIASITFKAAQLHCSHWNTVDTRFLPEQHQIPSIPTAQDVPQKEARNEAINTD